jgi:D-alanyl-lipoteichoic acid acyltransferase DltB (MBOAT superfamily)
LLASYGFYGFWDVRFLSLIVLSTGVDYFAALAMERGGEVRRKMALYASVIVNLSILGYFKYANFFLESFHEFLSAFSVATSHQSLDILLPVGISFYTFQSMSYTIDVYRNRTKVERNPLTFALYVAYFAQLMAGPIERSSALIPQLNTTRKWNTELFYSGFSRFVLGMVKKVAVSGPLQDWAEKLYLNPAHRSVEEAWAMAAISVLYVLMDFSGYSDMAVGIGRMTGIRLSENFRSIFKAQSFPDFWQRWHITLGKWFRDYVLISLRKRQVQKAVAVLITFTLIGFWHAASWSFLVWGFSLGILWWMDSRFEWIARLTSWIPSTSAIKLCRSVIVLMLFCWVGQLYCTKDLGEAWGLMKCMLGMEAETPGIIKGFRSLNAVTWYALILALGIEWLTPHWSRWQSNPHHTTAIDWIQNAVLIPLGILLCFEGLWTSRSFEYFIF